MNGNRDEIEFEITQRWMEAINRLKRDGQISSYRDLERDTGIANQRISIIKKFLSGKGRGAYATVGNIMNVCNFYKVNPFWVIEGKEPFYKGENDSLLNMVAETGTEYEIGKSGIVVPRNFNLIEEVVQLRKEVNDLKKKIP